MFRFYIFSIKLIVYYPSARNRRKIIEISIENSETKAIAGPGHKLDIPQPIPNIIAPIINLISITVLVGNYNLSE
jgi:hypothetical protein